MNPMIHTNGGTTWDGLTPESCIASLSLWIQSSQLGSSSTMPQCLITFVQFTLFSCVTFNCDFDWCHCVCLRPAAPPQSPRGHWCSALYDLWYLKKLGANRWPVSHTAQPSKGYLSSQTTSIPACLCPSASSLVLEPSVLCSVICYLATFLFATTDRNLEEPVFFYFFLIKNVKYNPRTLLWAV